MVEWIEWSDLSRYDSCYRVSAFGCRSKTTIELFINWCGVGTTFFVAGSAFEYCEGTTARKEIGDNCSVALHVHCLLPPPQALWDKSPLSANVKRNVVTYRKTYVSISSSKSHLSTLSAALRCFLQDHDEDHLVAASEGTFRASSVCVQFAYAPPLEYFLQILVHLFS
jgi:hypothetical protein